MITLYHKLQQTGLLRLFLKSLAFFTAIIKCVKRVFSFFARTTQLALKANKPMLRLKYVCYGLGYNTAATLQTIWAVNPNCYVEVIGLELNASVQLRRSRIVRLFDNWSYEYTEILTAGRRVTSMSAIMDY